MPYRECYAQLCLSGQYNSNAAFQVISNERSAVVTGESGNFIHSMGNSEEGGAIPLHIKNHEKASFTASTAKAHAVVTRSNSTLAWGHGDYGGVAMPNAASGGVVSLVSAQRAFAVLKGTGEVVAWGDVRYGGKAPAIPTPAVSIGSCDHGFSAVDAKGLTHPWGFPECAGSNIPPIDLSSTPPEFRSTTGTVWGYFYCNHRASNQQGVAMVRFLPLRVGVRSMVHINSSFAALTVSGTVVTWGDSLIGENTVDKQTDVVQLVQTRGAFAALTEKGSVIAWGEGKKGGSIPMELKELSTFRTLMSTDESFGAVDSRGSIFTWGNPIYGGDRVFRTSGVIDVVSTTRSFASLLRNRTVLTWGDPGYGGHPVWWLTDVASIHSNTAAFFAIRSNGEFVSWGDVATGGEVGSAALCEDCPAGTKSDTPGATGCRRCASHEWSPQGSYKCRACALGICDSVYLSIVLACCTIFGAIVLLLVYVSPSSDDNVDEIDVT